MVKSWVEGSLCDIIKNDPEFISKCPDIASDIFLGRLQLIKLIEDLGELLTNLDPVHRALGTQILSLTLKELPPDFLSTSELKFLADFFCDRIKDHHDVLPAVFTGILAICNMKNISSDVPSRLLSALFLNVNCQSQRQEDRHIIYLILKCLIEVHLNDIEAMGPDLVFGIISAMDGERDPRNLMLLFSMLPNAVKSLPLGHLTEEFFEVMACYFPVDFKPSSDDPGSVTREELAVRLSACLTAIPEFGEFCLPLLLEKLDSSLQIAKLDSLLLLVEGCKVFRADELAVHLSPLWMSLSREALTNGEEEVREAACAAVSSLLRSFAFSSLNSPQKTNAVQELLSYIITATTSTLNEAGTNLFFPSSYLLLAASKSCRLACETIIKKVVPLLCQLFHEKSAVSEKVILLQCLTMFLVTSLKMDVTPNDNPEFQTLWGCIVPLYLDTAQLKDSLLRKAAFSGLTSLVKTLSFDERQGVYNIICKAVDCEENDSIRDEIENCLCYIASLHPQEVMQSIVTEKLTISGTSLSLDSEIFKRRLSSLCQLAAMESFTMHVVPCVVDMIITSSNPLTVNACVSSLCKVVKSVEKNEDNKALVSACLHAHCQTVSRIIKWWMTGVRNSVSLDVFCCESILANTSALVRDIVKQLNSSDQSLLVDECIPQYFTFSDKSPSFDLSSPSHMTQTILLLEAIIGSLHRNVSIPSLYDLSNFVLNHAIRSQDHKTYSSACRLTATLVNKTPEGTVLDQILSNINSVVDSELASSCRDSKLQVPSLLGWVIKGLLLRGFKNVQFWIDKLLILLGEKSSDISMSAAESFQIIMNESHEYLNSDTHCTVKFLYRQRFFQCSAKLLDEYHKAPISNRSCYLLAIAHLLQGVPQTVLISNFGEVLPLLLESLALESVVVLLAALNTLQMLLNQPLHKDYLMGDIQTMVPRLLNLSSYKKSMKVRIKALGCLSTISSFPVDLLLPFKYEVVTHLLKCLDDPKRLVRSEAVKVRTKWILLDAPDEKEEVCVMEL